MAKGKFTDNQKSMIEDFINKSEKELEIKKISFRYDLARSKPFYHKEEILNDYGFKDDFFLEDLIVYKVQKKDKEIGKVYFYKFICKKLVGRDIITINIMFDNDPNIPHERDPFFHHFEYNRGLGVRIYEDNIPSVEQIDYSGFKYKGAESMKKDFKERDEENYKSRLGRGYEDLKEFFDDKREKLIKKLG